MKSYIFITTEGYTFQPESESLEPDIENCQVIGFAQGTNEQDAFENLIRQNDYLLEIAFDELICYELKTIEYNKNLTHFYLNDFKTNLR